MRPAVLLPVLLLSVLLGACQSAKEVAPARPLPPPPANLTGSLGLVGDAADVPGGPTLGGAVLMGGSTDVAEALRWMVGRAGGGDFLVLRASGTAAYNPYIMGLGPLNSVETLLLNSRTLADSPEVEAKIRGAEAVFIAGGDQANYVNFWKDTRVEAALNYLRNTKGVTIGGTSAGCAIQGDAYFAALNGTITSAEALADPYNSRLTLGRRDFLAQPYLTDVVTDTHFDNPDRRGRLVAFLARMSQDFGVLGRGIGVEERTAVCIDADGQGRVFGSGAAYFLRQNGPANSPETCAPNTRLDWNRDQRAVQVYKIAGTSTGIPTFNLATWTAAPGGPAPRYFYVSRGTLGEAE